MSADPNQAHDGATTALHRRTEELTAELAEWRRAYDEQTLKDGAEIMRLTSAIATERAAREQAERQLACTAETLRQAEARISGAGPHIDQLERERDTARSERDSWKGRAQLWQHMCETDLKAAETALASARARLLRSHQRALQCHPDMANEIGEALRILTSHPAPVAEDENCDEVWANTPQSQGAMGPAAVPTGRTPVLRTEFVALGEALGMGRHSCKNGHAWVLGTCGRCGEPKPEPVARTNALLCYEGDCAKMTGRARPCPVHDAAPVAAPCAGCAAARTFIERFCTVLSHESDLALVIDAKRWLKEHP